jgi:hypothetical protein
MSSEDYIPPDGRSIPFVFSKAGYQLPDEVIFNFAGPGKFGILKAAVNAVQPYWYHTHTYPKSCPKYVVGYGPGGIQIIRGRCTYGGIRDLRGIIKPWPMQDFPGYINGELWHGSGDLKGSVRPWHREIVGNLGALFHGWQEGDLSSIIGTHLPRDLTSFVRVLQREISDMPGLIHGWQELDFEAEIGTHLPRDLRFAAFVKQRAPADLPSLIHAWHARDLQGILGGVTFLGLTAFVEPIPAVNLPAYLKVWPQKFLPASTYGWGAKDLIGIINQIYAYDLPATLIGVSDTFKNLRARLKGMGSEYSDLPAVLQSFHLGFLTGIIRATYLNDISAYLFPILPKDVRGIIHAWHERFLQGIIGGGLYPWNLTASISSTGEWSLLSAHIWPKRGTNISSNLRALAHPWEVRNMPAYIFGDEAVFLRAYLNPLGYASDLHASIRPKMIRLTTLVNIPTFSHLDLSAIINFPCKKTGYSTLMALIYAKFKGDLGAYIRPIIYDYKPKLLGAKTGYTDAYLEIDKLNLHVNVLPDEFFSIDKFKLVINLLDAKNILAAYIKGILPASSLSAEITPLRLPTYTYDSLFKNRERVIHKTYDGVFRELEIVEMAFKSAVRDYYYSSDGDYAWKTNRFDRWILDIRSILPENTALKLKRRLHRATELYDLKRFASIDEAIKFAIAYVTEQPLSNLSAFLNGRGSYNNLSAMLNSRYIVSTKQSLGASITPNSHTIILGRESEVSKI